MNSRVERKFYTDKKTKFRNFVRLCTREDNSMVPCNIKAALFKQLSKGASSYYIPPRGGGGLQFVTLCYIGRGGSNTSTRSSRRLFTIKSHAKKRIFYLPYNAWSVNQTTTSPPLIRNMTFYQDIYR